MVAPDKQRCQCRAEQDDGCKVGQAHRGQQRRDPFVDEPKHHEPQKQHGGCNDTVPHTFFGGGRPLGGDNALQQPRTGHHNGNAEHKPDRVIIAVPRAAQHRIGRGGNQRKRAQPHKAVCHVIRKLRLGHACQQIPLKNVYIPDDRRQIVAPGLGLCRHRNQVLANQLDLVPDAACVVHHADDFRDGVAVVLCQR